MLLPHESTVAHEQHFITDLSSATSEEILLEEYSKKKVDFMFHYKTFHYYAIACQQVYSLICSSLFDFSK